MAPSYVSTGSRLKRSGHVPDAVLAEMWASRLTSVNVAAPPGLGVLNALLAGYWRIARPLL